MVDFDYQFLIEVLVGGLLSGVMYSLVAIGFVLVYKTSGVLNFAQGSMLLFAALTFGSAAYADDHHDAWSHDKHGYWDNHNGYHAFVEREHHHGYWRQRDDGTRVFINID